MDVSIIIPYNKDRGYLKQAIASASSQDFWGEYEVITECSDANVSVNINNAVKRCTGRYIKLLGEDDLLTTDCLAQLHTGAPLVCANALNVGEMGHCMVSRSGPPNRLRDLIRKNTIHGGTVLYRRDLLEKYPFDESLVTGEEYDLHLRLISDGYRFDYVDEVVYMYRIHLEQKSQQ